MDYKAVCIKYKRAIDAELSLAKSHGANEKKLGTRTKRLANVRTAIKGLKCASREFEVLGRTNYEAVMIRLEELDQSLKSQIKNRRPYISPRDGMVSLFIAILDRELGRPAKFYHDAMMDTISEDTYHLQRLILKIGYPLGASNIRTADNS